MPNQRCKNCGSPDRMFDGACACCCYRQVTDSYRDAAEEVRRITLQASLWHQCLLSAIWFGVAGTVPGLILLGFINNGGEPNMYPLALLLTLVPACVAAFYGILVGRRILDPSRVGTGFEAFVYGALVAFLSFVTVTFHVWLGIVLLYSHGNGVVGGAVGFLLALLLFGFLFVGVGACIIGGLAGWAFFSRYRGGTKTYPAI